MKKLYALLLAGIMTVAVALPTAAAPSPEADPIPAVVLSPAADSSVAAGNTVKTTVSNVGIATTDQYMAEEVVKVTSNAQVLKDLNVSSSAHLAASLEVNFSGAIPAGGVQVPFDVSGFAKKGDLVYILHRQSAYPYTWEVVGQSVLGDNLTVTGTFTSFSPVAFMVVDASQVAATGVKAPKTGE